MDRTIETHSAGQRMILAFAKALINDEPILILDEPKVTMDVPTARGLRHIVKELNRQGKTILYTTHLMHEAEELCDRVGIIDHGRIIALGKTADLQASISTEDIVELEGIFPETTVRRMREVPGIREVVVAPMDSGLTKLDVACENSRMMLPRIIDAVTEKGATSSGRSRRHGFPESLPLPSGNPWSADPRPHMPTRRRRGNSANRSSS